MSFSTFRVFCHITCKWQQSFIFFNNCFALHWFGRKIIDKEDIKSLISSNQIPFRTSAKWLHFWGTNNHQRQQQPASATKTAYPWLAIDLQKTQFCPLAWVHWSWRIFIPFLFYPPSLPTGMPFHQRKSKYFHSFFSCFLNWFVSISFPLIFFFQNFHFFSHQRNPCFFFLFQNITSFFFRNISIFFFLLFHFLLFSFLFVFFSFSFSFKFGTCRYHFFSLLSNASLFNIRITSAHPQNSE